MVTLGFLWVVGEDQTPDFVVEVDRGEDMIMVEWEGPCLDGVAGCTHMCMSDLWIVVEAEVSGCTTRRRGRGEGNGV